MLDSCYEMSVAQVLEKANRSSPDKEVIYDGTRRLSFADLNSEANEIALGLSKMGIITGDRVAVSLPIWYEFIVLVYAIAKIGAILVPFNTRFHENEVEHILKDSGTKAVFFSKDADKINHLDQLQSIQKCVKSLQYLIPVRFEHEGLKSYQTLRQNGRKEVLPELKVNVKEDVFAIIYTSGTSGIPKGVMLTHYNLVCCAVRAILATKTSKNDVFLHATPFFHIMGIGAILRLIISEARVVILDTYKPEPVLKLIQEEKITVHPGVPTLYALELNHPNFKSYDLSSLRMAGMAGAPCPVKIIRRVKSEMGCPVLVSYGMTETAPTLTFTSFEDDDLIQAETVGRAVDGVELKVIDDKRREVTPGEVGELACRTETLMKGYYNLPEKTREVIDDEGWFYTGDLATIDASGYVRIVGRKKDMIIRGGYNVYPSEIEDAFYVHPAVAEVAIVGLPDTVLGEVSCAAIVLRPECTASAEELKIFIADEVADYKTPDHIVIFKKLPRTASGKVKKYELKNIILQGKMVSLR